MQESTIDETETTADEPSRVVNIKGVLSTIIGAVVAVALLLALGVWFYRLGVRDAQNVPIIRAALDPVKVRPEDPGGTETPHQDITSYQVAESEPVQSAATVIAPAPPEPRPEDVAMGDLNTVVPAVTVAPTQTPTVSGIGAADIAVASDDAAESLQAEIDRQVAAVLSEQPARPEPQPESAESATPAVSETPPVEALVTPPSDPAATNPTEGETAQETYPEQDAEEIAAGTAFAPSASPVVPRRPTNLLARVEEAKEEAAQSVTDLASRAAQSRVQVQLAADPDESAIRQQWRRIYNANSDVLRDRALAVQQTVSGGTTFYRLRVGPFKDTSEARAVCQALKARGQDCIVARNG